MPNPLLSASPSRGALPSNKLPLVLTTLLVFTPGALAFEGDNFSNNLFSDLAPLLALFGEQVAKQFLSHTTSWLECVIFACNPISIITGATSAIRVGGSRWLKSVIGRAGEAEASAELELMSSTSSDVCELWNGVGVVRVVGSPAIVELIYRTRNPNSPDSTVQLSSPADVYTLDKARIAGLYKLKDEKSEPTTVPDPSSSARIQRSPTVVEQIENQLQPPPNIFRNTSTTASNRLELILIAVIGVVSQAAVLVYDAGITYHPRWRKDKSPDTPVQTHAFPLTCVGTLGMVLGMFICAMVIDAKTREERWEAVDQGGNDPLPFQVVWLQKGQLVGDQAFGSFAIYAPRNQRVITKSWKEQGHLARLEFWSLWGSALAIAGFVCQFVGLRDMHWSAAIAQLIATIVMTLLRVVIRRHLSALPKVHPLPEGYELDFMAKEITQCDDWRILAVSGLNHPNEHQKPSDLSAFAAHTLYTRVRLSELTVWKTECSEIAEQVTRTIHAVMNHLFEAGSGVSISPDASKYSEFTWRLPVAVARTSGEETGQISLKLHREFSENRWTPWRLEQGELESVISLWMSHFANSGAAANLWVLDEHNIFSSSAYDWWIYRGTTSVLIQNLGDVCGANRVDYNRVMNLTSEPLPDDLQGHVFPGGEELLGVVTRSSLQQMCGQYLVGVFLSRVTGIIDNLGGKTDVVSGVGRSSYTLVNKNIRKIAEEVQRYNLATVEDSYRLVVAPLSQAGKLRDPLDDLSVLRQIISMHQDNPDPNSDQFAVAHKHLVAYCTAKAALLSEKDNWKGAREAFTQLMDVSREVLGTYHKCTLDATKAMKDFAAEFVDKHSPNVAGADPNQPHSSKGAFLLHSAAIRGDLRGVLEKLEDGYGVDTWNAESRTSLGLVLEHGHPDIARLLLFYGADIQWAATIDDIGKSRGPRQNEVERILLLNWGDLTLLNKAAAGGKDTIIMILMAGKRLDVSAKDEQGWTALHHASNNGHETTIKLLLKDFGADPAAQSSDGQTALHLAVEGKYKHVIKLLVEGGVNVNAHDSEGRTALHVAAANGLDEIVEELVTHGADVNSEDNEKLPILHVAVMKRHKTIIKFLVDHGADLTAKNGRGYTPLHCACETDKDAGIIDFLLEKGSDMAAKDMYARTPLAIAASSGREEAIRLLLSKGADVRISGDNCGRSLLDIASRIECLQVVKLLIENGVDLENKDGFERMALHYATLEGREEAVRLLIAKGVDIDAQDIDGWTPLHFAYRNRRKSIVTLLLDGGASNSITDRHGRTASYYSQQHFGDLATYSSRALAD